MNATNATNEISRNERNLACLAGSIFFRAIVSQEPIGPGIYGLQKSGNAKAAESALAQPDFLFSRTSSGGLLTSIDVFREKIK